MGIISKTDPYETVIKAMLAYAPLTEVCGQQIANRHKYGQTNGNRIVWEQDSQALTLSPIAGAPPDLYLPIHNVTMQATCFGDTFPDAEQVYLALQSFTRNTESETIATSGGLVLLYRIILTSAPSSTVLDEVRTAGGMPALLVTLRAEVEEDFC